MFHGDRRGHRALSTRVGAADARDEMHEGGGLQTGGIPDCVSPDFGWASNALLTAKCGAA